MVLPLWALLTAALIFPQYLRAETTPRNCDCQDCKNIISEPYKGKYELGTTEEQERCIEGCFYKEVGGQGNEVCMCDPGDVQYVMCDNVTTTRCIIHENGEVFTQTNIFNEEEGTLEMYIPSHRDLAPSVVILNQESDTNLLQSGDTCQLSSVPEMLNIRAMGEQFGRICSTEPGEESGDMGTINSNNSIEYCVLKVTESRLGIKERKKVFQLAQEQCGNKPIIRTRDILVPIEDCENNGTVIVDYKDAIITTASPCLIVEACSNVGPQACGYGWTNPDPNSPAAGFTFHQVSTGSICVMCTIGTGCNSTYCACIDIQNKEDLMDCRLCSDPIIENEIDEDGTNFNQTTSYTCKEYDRRAVVVDSPAHNNLQDIKVIMNARSDGYWHVPGLENNVMVKLAGTCYVGTLPSYVYPIDIAIGLQEIAAGNTVITEEDEYVRYTMLIKEGPIDISPLHELVKEACENDTVVEGPAMVITKEDMETLRGGGIIFTEGPKFDNESCVQQTANAMLRPASGCVRWPNLGSGEKLAVHSLYTAVTSVDCWDGVNCPEDLCLCSEIANITSFMACNGNLSTTHSSKSLDGFKIFPIQITTTKNQSQFTPTITTIVP